MQPTNSVRRGFLSMIIAAVLQHRPSHIIKELRSMADAVPKLSVISGRKSRGGLRSNGGQLRTRTIAAKRMHASGRSTRQSRKYARA